MLKNPSSTVLVTGAAGFIGYHVASRLLRDGRVVVGLDNLNSYYSPVLKQDRLAQLGGMANWSFREGDLGNAVLLEQIVHEFKPRCVVHLGAQAGVRWSLENPKAYIDSNLVGFANVLECCRHGGVEHLLYASSSSVYGANTKVPFRVGDTTDHPVSLYAATKKANEGMAHCYSHLFGLPCTGLRFFTVYGPWGRPDMAYWKFTEAILEGRPIDVYGDGLLQRDFTYIDDVVESVVRLVDRPPSANLDWDGDRPDPASSRAPWRLYNIGNHSPVLVNRLIEEIEELCDRKAVRSNKPKPPGDVDATFADVSALQLEVQFSPKTPLALGLKAFVEWYKGWRCRNS
jgi:UDP-glucuronate 4-epimerase